MKLNTFSILVLCLLLVCSCKDKNSITQDTDNLFKFRDYISYTTSGLQSVTNPITINLAKDVEGWEMGQDITQDLIKISPYAEGSLKVLNTHTLLFTPDEYLEPATEYTVLVKLNEIYKNMPKDYEDYVFQFKTITPNFSLSTNDLQSYSKKWQYLEAVIKSADMISIDDAKTLVKASQNGKPLTIHFNELIENSKFFEFRIDSINRLVEDSEILVEWDGKSINAKNKGENKYAIPGINNFTVVNVESVKSPEQYLSVNFSDPLKKQQNFEGLVVIENSENPKFSVDGNVLKIYPERKLVGDLQVHLFEGIKNIIFYSCKVRIVFNSTDIFI